MTPDCRVNDSRPTAQLPVLRLRAEMLNWMRQFFIRQSYWEVETPLLSHDVCVDAWLEPFRVDPDRTPEDSTLYLQTSPEFGMKRLLAAGADAIFQITRAFRQEEVGPLHNPEFTIVEWYRIGETYRQQMDLVEQLAVEFEDHVAASIRMIEGLPAALATDLRPHDKRRGASRQRPFQRLSYDEAFLNVVGEGVISKSAADLRRLALQLGIVGPDSLRADDRDGWLNLLLADAVEPMLAERGAAFVYDFPASQAALAKIRLDEPPVAERFELYLDGIEICTGYQELIDPVDLRRRQSVQSTRRKIDGRRQLPEESRLLAAMEAGLPACAGVALGFDRLLLTALGKSDLGEVIPFPIDRA